jgi:diguanylate cyclase (GGDEF)-like protein
MAMSERFADASILPGQLASDPAQDGAMQRIGRIGRQLFGVAGCVISIPAKEGATFDSGATVDAAERIFCRELPLSPQASVVLDTMVSPALRVHRLVDGPPHIRFCAIHPVHDADRVVVGSVVLIDYAPRRVFRESERQLLADLAALVERELAFRVVNASQLDLQKKNKSLRRKSLMDPLIGTWNRGAIMRILSIEAVRCEKAGLPLSLIVVDLDYFKKINDSHGHPAGDAVLVKVASRLRSCIRPQEALGRYGGEEFLIVLPGSSHATAMTVAERMRAVVAAQPETVGNTMLNLTISAGVASTDQFPAIGTDELISRADVALYAAKDAGRNRVLLAQPDLS